MKKRLTCVECPKGCVLSVDIENCMVVDIIGSECPKGKKYAADEIENPVRILTSAVLTEGLSLKMVPVRTDKPVPKNSILKAMEEVKKARISKAVPAGEIIIKNLLNLDVNLISTREVKRV